MIESKQILDRLKNTIRQTEKKNTFRHTDVNIDISNSNVPRYIDRRTG